MLRKSEGNLPPDYLENNKKKKLRTLIVKKFDFNNKLVIRDSGYCVSK